MCQSDFNVKRTVPSDWRHEGRTRNARGMKGNAVFKRSYNRCLRQLEGCAIGTPLSSESELVQALDVSRTTVRAVLVSLAEAGIIGQEAGARIVLRQPGEADFFPDTQTLSAG